MRERLMELIDAAFIQCDSNFGTPSVNQVADYLLENGVIVPPVKVGDTVYHIYWLKGENIGEATVEEVYYNGDGFAYHVCHEYNYFDLQHEEVFLTREEAEQALKEREKT